MGGFIDIEDALQAALNEAGFSAHAKPLPEGFATPCVTVDMLNAQQENAAQARYSVDFDCRAGDYAQAAELQASVANWLLGIGGTELGGVPCYVSGDPLLQRAQSDASHPTCILATVSASLLLRIAD